MYSFHFGLQTTESWILWYWRISSHIELSVLRNWFLLALAFVVEFSGTWAISGWWFQVIWPCPFRSTDWRKTLISWVVYMNNTVSTHEASSSNWYYSSVGEERWQLPQFLLFILPCVQDHIRHVLLLPSSSWY